MKFGEYLRQRRADLGWTQPEAAVKAGIEQSYLSKLETGRSIPSGDVYQRLAEAYGIETRHMVGVLYPAELDRLREVDAVREMLLGRERRSRSMSRGWLVAGLAMLVIGGGLLGLSLTDRGGPVQLYTYQSSGVIQPGEGLGVFDDLDREPDPAAGDYAAQVESRDAMIARLDEQTRSIPEMKGPSFIENTPDGMRVWNLVGSSGAKTAGAFGWALAPGLALIIGGLGCFFVSWRWP